MILTPTHNLRHLVTVAYAEGGFTGLLDLSTGELTRLEINNQAFGAPAYIWQENGILVHAGAAYAGPGEGIGFINLDTLDARVYVPEPFDIGLLDEVCWTRVDARSL